MFLGKPSNSISEFIKDQWCDIFIKEDGTKVRPNYNSSKTIVNIFEVEDYGNVKQFNFGKSYTEIDNLYYYDKKHGIDLSRTNINSFYDTYLNNNQLTSLQLPDSLTGFYELVLNNSCILNMSHITDETNIPQLDYCICNENWNTYTGIIQIRSGLLTTFQNKWGSQYNYQEV